MSLLRQGSIDDIREVKRATLETDGKLSVIKMDEAKEAQKSDLKKLSER